MNHWYIIYPRGRFSCITPVLRFKFAKFDCTDSNVRKRPFPSAVLTNGVLSLWIPSMLVSTRPATYGWLSRRVQR